MPSAGVIKTGGDVGVAEWAALLAAVAGVFVGLPAALGKSHQTFWGWLAGFLVVMAIALGVYASINHGAKASADGNTPGNNFTSSASSSNSAAQGVPSSAIQAQSSSPSSSLVTAPSTPPPSSSQASLAIPPGGIALPASSWKTVGGASIINSEGDTFEVLYDPTYWGGLFATANAGCSYTFTGQARVVSGSGYSFAVWASVDSGGTPHGESIQYDVDSGGYKDVALPDGSETGQLQDATLDNNWHTISVRVSNGAYVSSVDGHAIFAGPMPGSCTQGVFIRLWRTDVEFRDLSVTRL